MAHSEPIVATEIGKIMTWSEEKNISATFHDFENFALNKDVRSPCVRCHGYDWQIQIKPKED